MEFLLFYKGFTDDFTEFYGIFSVPVYQRIETIELERKVLFWDFFYFGQL